MCVFKLQFKFSQGPWYEYCILNILKDEYEMRRPPTAAEALRSCLSLRIPQETSSISGNLSFPAFINRVPRSPPVGFC